MGEAMSKSGYQQFFKKAQDVKRGDDVRFKVKPTVSAPKQRSSEETERLLRQAVRVKSRRPRPPFPWKAASGLVAGLALGMAYLITPETFEHIFDKVEIRAMGSAQAAEKGDKPAAEKSAAKSEKDAATETKDGAAKSPDSKEAVSEDFSHFEKLKQRKEELDRREKELGELEEELQRQKVELDKRITQLEDMRNQIAQILKDRVEVDQEKVNKLVDLYSNMKPKQAADVIASINEELAVEVLAKMKKKNAAEIMNLLPADKARVLSEKYTGYRRNHPGAADKG
jgi:flagellar motility protein MotE (MotC chaperone)